MPEAVIRTDGLTKAFGGHMAVYDVTVEIEPYTFTSIIGPNGAGKTTFFNLISGQLYPSKGKVFLKEQDITSLEPHDRALRGLGRSFQLANLFPGLTVLENVRLALQSRQANKHGILWSPRLQEAQEKQAMGYLSSVRLDSKATMHVTALSHGEKRKLEIAVIMAMDPVVMLLDEPTAGMSVEEVPGILEILTEIKKSQKCTILLVEHKIDMVMSLSDKIIVLINGGLLAYDSPVAIMHHPQVMSAYLGEA